MVKKGAIFQSTTDTEAFLHLIAQSNKTSIVKKVIDALYELEGAFSIGLLTNKKLIAIKDPLGIRPLVLGDLNGAKIIASETCALDIIGAKYIRDVENGEVVVIDKNGIKSYKPFPKIKARPCIFEYIYFARPDSIMEGKSIYDVERKMGIEIAEQTNADIVIGTDPDCDRLGIAEESKIPYDLGIIRNHYVGRTFIEPTQNIRQFGVLTDV